MVACTIGARVKTPATMVALVVEGMGFKIFQKRLLKECP